MGSGRSAEGGPGATASRCSAQRLRGGHSYEEDVLIHRTDHVLFHKENFYSPSANKTYLAPLPAGYEG